MLALWRCGGTASIPMPTGKQAIGIEGAVLASEPEQPLTISDSVVYLVDA